MFTFPLAFSRHYGILMGGFYGKKVISVEKLSRSDHIDLYRHLAFSAVGGFSAATLFWYTAASWATPRR